MWPCINQYQNAARKGKIELYIYWANLVPRLFSALPPDTDLHEDLPSDEGPTLDTLDYTIRISSTPTFLYFDLYLYSAYAAHYVYMSSNLVLTVLYN